MYSLCICNIVIVDSYCFFVTVYLYYLFFCLCFTICLLCALYLSAAVILKMSNKGISYFILLSLLYSNYYYCNSKHMVWFCDLTESNFSKSPSSGSSCDYIVLPERILCFETSMKIDSCQKIGSVYVLFLHQLPVRSRG